MAQVQILVIGTGSDNRTATMARLVGELTAIEESTAIVVVDGEDVRVPVHLVWGLDRSDILESAIVQLSNEVLDDRACLYAAVGEVVERSEPVDYNLIDTEYVVPGEDFDRMRDAWGRVRDTPGEAA